MIAFLTEALFTIVTLASFGALVAFVFACDKL